MRRLAAIDLGTNTVRLLVVEASGPEWRALHEEQSVTRLGQGQAATGVLQQAAMRRTVDVVAAFVRRAEGMGVRDVRIVATSAVREAGNGTEFLAMVGSSSGREVRVISGKEEASLTLLGVAEGLPDLQGHFLLFDIGGGSSELIWLDLTRLARPWRRSIYDRLEVQSCIAGWTSLPIGVVNLAERHGGREVGRENYEAMVADVMAAVAGFEAQHRFGERIAGRRAHFLGTSGTVTTISGIHLKLPVYERSRVDGCWLSARDVRNVSGELIGMSYAERVAQPCIGQERADLVLAGCAILEALLRVWPCQRLRVADRGLREGILATLMSEDGHGGAPHQRHHRWPHAATGSS